MDHVPHRCGTAFTRRDGLSRLWKRPAWDGFCFLTHGKWQIEGRTQAGERRELHIDATSGKTLRNERD